MKRKKDTNMDVSYEEAFIVPKEIFMKLIQQEGEGTSLFDLAKFDMPTVSKKVQERRQQENEGIDSKTTLQISPLLMLFPNIEHYKLHALASYINRYLHDGQLSWDPLTREVIIQKEAINGSDIVEVLSFLFNTSSDFMTSSVHKYAYSGTLHNIAIPKGTIETLNQLTSKLHPDVDPVGYFKFSPLIRIITDGVKQDDNTPQRKRKKNAKSRIRAIFNSNKTVREQLNTKN